MTNAIRITIIASASTVGAAIIGGLGYVAGKSRATKQLLAKTEQELMHLREQQQADKHATELHA